MMSSLVSLLVILPFTTSMRREKFERHYYTKELLLLWDSSGRKPCNLNVHKYSNTLFFCLYTPSNFAFQLAYYNIDTRETHTIIGVKKGCAIAIDQANSVVYLGGLSGIYKLNMDTLHPEYFAEKGVYIKSLFYHDRLYYVRYPDGKLFMEYGTEFAHVAEFMELEIDLFHVDKKGIVYFSVQNSIYIYDKNETQWNVKGLREISAVNAISEDDAGVIYVCTNRGVFTIIRNGLQKFMHERNILGITTDKDNNLILADDKSIFRMLKNEPV